MKNKYAPMLAPLLLALIVACSKPHYTNTDNTTGIAGITKQWTGYAEGYMLVYTVMPTYTVTPTDTAHVAYAQYYHRVINDTAFAVQKIDGYQVDVLGAYMDFRTNDATTHVTTFDSTLPGSPQSFLKYCYGRDSISVEYHKVGTYNALSGHYFESNYYLHTH